MFMSLESFLFGEKASVPAGAMIAVWAVLGTAAAVFLALYVLQALFLQKIANKRGNKNGWLAWLPFGFRYLLGRIADDQNHLQKRRTFYRLSAPLLQAGFWLCLVAIGFLQRPVWVVDGGRRVLWYVSELPLFLWIAMGLCLTALCAQTAVKCVALYRIYWDYQPEQANKWLIVSVLLPVTVPFFLLGISGKEPYEERVRRAAEEKARQMQREVTPEDIALERLHKHELQERKEEEKPSVELPQELFVVESREDGRNPFAPRSPQAQG